MEPDKTARVNEPGQAPATAVSQPVLLERSLEFSA